MLWMCLEKQRVRLGSRPTEPKTTGSRWRSLKQGEKKNRSLPGLQKQTRDRWKAFSVNVGAGGLTTVTTLQPQTACPSSCQPSCTRSVSSNRNEIFIRSLASAARRELNLNLLYRWFYLCGVVSCLSCLRFYWFWHRRPWSMSKSGRDWKQHSSYLSVQSRVTRNWLETDSKKSRTGRI